MPPTVTETTWQPRLDEDKPGYRDLVRAVESDIRAGRLRPGEQLPTHRELSAVLGISRGTVARAYDEAQRLGLLTSGIGQGTFVSNSFGVRARQVAESDEIDFGMSFPIYELDPDPSAALAALARDPHRRDLLRYPSPGGQLSHRIAGARWCEESGVVVDPDRVVLTAGAQNATHLWLLSILRPGGTLLTGELTYRMVVSAAEVAGLQVRGVPMDREGILPDALADMARETKARGLYMMPTLQNPTTGVLSPSRRRAVLEVAETYGLQILEDDIHGLFHDAGDEPRPTPLKALCPERVTYVSSISKIVAGGLRVAFAVPPPNHLPAYRTALLGSQYTTPPLTAEIAARWIDDGTAFATVDAKRREGEERLALLREQLGPLVPDLRTGVYLAWMTLPEPWSAVRFTMEARYRRVTVMPAESFYVGDGVPPEAIRISMGIVSRQQIRRGLNILAELLAHPRSARGLIV